VDLALVSALDSPAFSVALAAVVSVAEVAEVAEAAEAASVVEVSVGVEVSVVAEAVAAAIAEVKNRLNKNPCRCLCRGFLNLEFLEF
jgi:hypothetical protein